MMRKIILIAASLPFFALIAIAQAGPAKSPYAGQEKRSIKSLSAAEIRDLLDGKGMGFAKAAELNHYPGPVHVIAAAGAIGLAEGQLAETKELHRKMKAEAVGLGQKIVGKEKELNESFAGERITEAGLKRAVGEIASLRGDLRTVHLKYHLKMKKLLSPHQIALYDRARGYTGGTGGAGAMDHNKHGTR